MGQPAFECERIFAKHNVVVFSSNWTLYGDMSARVMQVLAEYASDIEIYSVDEAFLHLSEFEENSLYEQAKYIRAQVLQKTGIPVSIGIGYTKTLAKIANKLAKKNPHYGGVLDITAFSNIDPFLKATNVEDIWGIGYRYAQKLKNRRILTAYDFRNQKEDWVKKNMTITGLKTLLEIKGAPCFDVATMPQPKKSITVSRLFGRSVTNLIELKEALATYISIAAQKLRKQNSVTSHVIIFTVTCSYHDSQRFYNSTSYQLPISTSYTPDLIKAAYICIQKLFMSGIIYKKVGVIFAEITDSSFIQLDISKPIPNFEKQTNIINAIDKANQKLGKDKIIFAAAGTKKGWKTKQLKKSQCYTTSWHELLTIKI